MSEKDPQETRLFTQTNAAANSAQGEGVMTAKPVSQKTGQKGGQKSGMGETLKTILYAVFIALIFRTFLYEPFNIPSESMLPNLLVGDYLFVSKASYGYGRYSAPVDIPALSNRVWKDMPQSGDVAVFRSPEEPDVAFIKRIIGLPGDVVEVRFGRLHLNGEPVDKTQLREYYREVDSFGNVRQYPYYEETLPNGVTYKILEQHGDQGRLDHVGPFTVPEGHFFAMGDNRDQSRDSRDPGVGFIPIENLIGEAQVLFFSIDYNKADWWQVWRWPEAIRFSRLLQAIE